MKLTKNKLKQLIREEIGQAYSEESFEAAVRSALELASREKDIHDMMGYISEISVAWDSYLSSEDGGGSDEQYKSFIARYLRV